MLENNLQINDMRFYFRRVPLSGHKAADRVFNISHTLTEVPIG